MLRFAREPTITQEDRHRFRFAVSETVVASATTRTLGPGGFDLGVDLLLDERRFQCG